MFDLLHDRVIRVNDDARNLPELLVMLDRDEVHTYPGARLHQEDAFHAFVVQLASYAMTVSDTAKLPKTTSAWRDLLASLTTRHQYAWHLIAPHKNPAFFQPAADSVTKWNFTSTPAGIDAIRPCKEFDTKIGPVPDVSMDQWMFALIALQTTTASNSSKYAQTSRMNGGLSARFFVGVNGNPGHRFGRDVGILLARRDEIVGYAKRSGTCLTWLVPWGGFIQKNKLDPFFLDTPRRVRLVEGGALFTNATGMRTLGKDAGSLTGDPWAPIKKSVTIAPRTLDYRAVAPILVGDGVDQSMCQDILDDDLDPVEIKFSILTGGQPAKTTGYHVRTVYVPSQLRSLVRRRDQMLGQATREHIDKLGAAQSAIKGAIMIGLSAYHASRRRALTSAANVAIQTWFLEEDARFFDDLWDEIGSADRTKARESWTIKMLDRALQAVRDGCDAIPQDQTCWAARAKAEHFFRAVTWKLRV